MCGELDTPELLTAVPRQLAGPATQYGVRGGTLPAYRMHDSLRGRSGRTSRGGHLVRLLPQCHVDVSGGSVDVRRLWIWAWHSEHGDRVESSGGRDYRATIRIKVRVRVSTSNPYPGRPCISPNRDSNHNPNPKFPKFELRSDS